MRIYTIISWNVYYIIKLGVIFFLFVILQIYEDISLEIILYGKDNFSEEQIVDMFYAVYDTHRFH